MNEQIMKPGQAAFSLNQISKRFGATLALNQIDFSADAGEIIGLIGPNCAGKSTMMGILTGVVPATEGSFVISGRTYAPSQYNTAIARENGIACAYYMACSNNDNAVQVSQIQNFIMMGADAIIVDPGSATALNGAIDEAVDAGISVLVFNDGPVTTSSCYQLNVDCVYNFGYLAEWACKKLDYKGDVLIIRGLPGNSYDELAYKGMIDVINSYEGMNVVGEVYGEWTSTVAQSEVAAILPSLSNVDMVIGQGGDAYGAAMAFTAAGMDVPLITAGNRGDFLNWWMDEYKKNGYETISGMASPWFAAASLYMMIDILDGVEVPQYMYYPMETITVDNLFDYEGIADTAVAAEEHDWDWVRETLETQDSAANKPEMVTD